MIKTPPPPGPLRHLALSGLLAVQLLLLAGCATQKQVRDIVHQSNAASLASELGLNTPDPNQPGGQGADWQQASAKIESFIAAHPDSAAANASLRVRQAMMLLNNRQYNLAQAAFGEAKLEALRGSSRDRSLKRLENVLLWWYPRAGGSLTSSDYLTASNALTQIQIVWSDLQKPQEEDIRDWLAALRAWIALKMANDADADVLGQEAPRLFLEDAINAYTQMLPASETGQWQNNPDFPPRDLTREIAISHSQRRRFRAHDLIEGARRAMANNAITQPRFDDDYFRRRILNPPSP